ncbi:hypothetical protein PPTG_24655 [Phytophthora nicotianae INRA-310]|uniref:Uncharacterized protein n=1 Tax=Phytophthora nicotianae (strain INRA-310) TaxID=761204 RepID=W2PDQ5_PHYN3|nr:hypothetical protein PPTG_24655 [Phytophthora nicotianae INRA-310]ETM98318.1 hypothetical protein PPTG_24655 [Phytophthora nicotianae INRA-310]
MTTSSFFTAAPLLKRKGTKSLATTSGHLVAKANPKTYQSQQEKIVNGSASFWPELMKMQANIPSVDKPTLCRQFRGFLSGK